MTVRFGGGAIIPIECLVSQSQKAMSYLRYARLGILIIDYMLPEANLLLGLR